jgi:purine-binding chemotaxis protein CheW
MADKLSTNPRAAEHESDELSNEDRYLLFEGGEQLFGAPLLQVREIIELQECKPIPATRPYFLGVINLRGKIVGVFDLRRRLGLAAVDKPTNVFIVFESSSGILAALVDRVMAVATIPEDEIERDPSIKSNVPVKYLIGIGRHQERMVTLIELQELLDEDEIAEMTAA